jgi:protein SCO1
VPSRTRPRHPSRRITELRRRGRLPLGVALLALTALGGCRARELPVLGTVPAFTLTERSGQPLRAEDLAGHVWIADFVFTRCPDVCPALTARMARLQPTGDRADAVRLVSFSVDPAHDTPEVLRTYAERAGARGDWLFVTGSRDAMAALLRDGFRVAFADDGPPTSPITHSDRFVLVDRQLRIRGYYHGSDPNDVDRLARDAGDLRDGRLS